MRFRQLVALPARSLWLVTGLAAAFTSCGDSGSNTPAPTTTTTAPVTPPVTPSATATTTSPVAPTTSSPSVTPSVTPITPPSVTPTTSVTPPVTPPTATTTDTTPTTTATTSEPTSDTSGPVTETPTEVAWTQSGNTWSATIGDTTFRIDAGTGGRVLGFALGNKEMLLDEDEITYESGGDKPNANNYGSTFWLSPQSQWNEGGWPPPEHIDSDDYEASVEGPMLTLVGEEGSGADDNTADIAITKIITPDDANNAVTIEYQMKNNGAAASLEWAPWEITRVGVNGVSFFPTGPGDCDAGCPKELTIAAQGAYSFWAYDNGDISDADGSEYGDKWVGDGAKGWIGHVSEGVLLLLQFEDIAAGDAAPKEGDVEIYASAQDDYVELEPQGAAKSIPAGESISWKVRWSLHTLPGSLAAEPGTALGEFADAVATQLGSP